MNSYVLRARRPPAPSGKDPVDARDSDRRSGGLVGPMACHPETGAPDADSVGDANSRKMILARRVA